MIEITVDNQFTIHNIFMISTVLFLPNNIFCLFFTSGLPNQRKKNLVKNIPEMFILNIYSSTISFWTGTSNVEYFINFNNAIWINILCT